jgi:diguanylate cyclase (GGDEF)-like protein
METRIFVMYDASVIAGALRGLSLVAKELSRSRPVDASVQRVTDIALDVVGADHASVRICGSNAELRSLARSGVGADVPAPTFRKGEGLMGWAAQTGEIVRVSDSPTDARFQPNPARGYEARSIMSVPLHAGERILGVFSVSSSRVGAFEVEHEHAALVLAHCVGQALRTAELERLATTDALTRTFNRSHLLPCIETEMNRSQRESKPLSVLLLDLDHFKDVNDRWGHAVGDAALCAFVDVVRGCVRNFDVLVRRGGEEFELVMPGTGTVEGWKVAERIRTRLCQHALEIRGDIDLKQTVSIGLATWDGHESASSLDQRADLALYEAKRRGRDRTVTAPMPEAVPAV